jgi:tetratricopeptide (TPR) repeat protein
LAGLKPEEQQQFYSLFAAMASTAHVEGLTVIRQWENRGRYFTTVAVPLAALENIPCEFQDLSSAISSYVDSDHVSRDGLAFCLRHVPRYSYTNIKIREKIGRLYQDRGLNVLAAPFLPDQLQDWGNSPLGALAFQHRLTQTAQLTDHAKQFTGQGKWDEALKTVARALDLVPTYSRAYLLLADYFLQQGKPEFALCVAEKAVRDGTSFRDALKKIISCLEELNSTEAEVFRYLLGQSNHDRTYSQDWEAEIGQLAEANALISSLVIESAGQAVEGPFGPPSAEFNQAVALFQQSKNDDDILRSLALLISACEKQPFSAKTYNLIGVCYRHLGKPAVAFPFLWQALKLRPEYDFALTNLGLCCQSLGLMEAARYYFKYDAVKNSTNAWVQESYAKFVETIYSPPVRCAH